MLFDRATDEIVLENIKIPTKEECQHLVDMLRLAEPEIKTLQDRVNNILDNGI